MGVQNEVPDIQINRWAGVNIVPIWLLNIGQFEKDIRIREKIYTPVAEASGTLNTRFFSLQETVLNLEEEKR